MNWLSGLAIKANLAIFTSILINSRPVVILLDFMVCAVDTEVQLGMSYGQNVIFLISLS